MSLITNVQYDFFAKLIYQKTGNVFKEDDYYRLEGRLNDLMIKYDFKSIEELINFFTSRATAVDYDNLINIATNNETLFFRDVKPFNALKDEIVEDVLSKRDVKMLRIWSAASSTGQEAYSIAMTISDNFPNLAFSIDATDISKAAVNKAQSGVYSKLELQRGLPSEYKDKFFDNVDATNWKVKSHIQSKVNFIQLNLLTDNIPVDKYDIVFCRNVIIYFDISNRQLLFEKVEKSMRDYGKLILGSGESTIGIKTNLKSRQFKEILSFEK